MEGHAQFAWKKPYNTYSQSTLIIFSQFHHDKSLNHNLPLSVRFNSDHSKSSPDICYIEMSWLNLPHYCMCDIWYSALHRSCRTQKREHVGELQGWMTKQTTANTNHCHHRLPGFQPTSFLLLLSAEVGILPQRCGSPQKLSHFCVCKVWFTSCCAHVFNLIFRNRPERSCLAYFTTWCSKQTTLLGSEANKTTMVQLSLLNGLEIEFETDFVSVSIWE